MFFQKPENIRVLLDSFFTVTSPDEFLFFEEIFDSTQDSVEYIETSLYPLQSTTDSAIFFNDYELSTFFPERSPIIQGNDFQLAESFIPLSIFPVSLSNPFGSLGEISSLRFGSQEPFNNFTPFEIDLGQNFSPTINIVESQIGTSGDNTIVGTDNQEFILGDPGGAITNFESYNMVWSLDYSGSMVLDFGIVLSGGIITGNYERTSSFTADNALRSYANQFVDYGDSARLAGSPTSLTIQMVHWNGRSALERLFQYDETAPGSGIYDFVDSAGGLLGDYLDDVGRNFNLRVAVGNNTAGTRYDFGVAPLASGTLFTVSRDSSYNYFDNTPIVADNEINYFIADGNPTAGFEAVGA